MNSKENIFKYEPDTIQDSNLNFYYGITSCLSNISDNKNSLAETLEHRYKNNLDFIFITEHNSLLKAEVKYKSARISKWAYFITTIKKYSKKHLRPIAVIGFESKTHKWGNLNILNSKNYFDGEVKNLSLLLLWMLVNEDGMIFIDHSHKPSAVMPYNPLLNKFIISVKVRRSHYFKYYYELLDAGWKLGVVSSQDDSQDSENHTCIISNKLNKNSLFESFRKRRTYSTESKTLKAYFTINGYFMGDIINKGDFQTVDIFIFLQDFKYKINKFEIIANNGQILKVSGNVNLYKIKYFVKIPFTRSITWLLVKIYQDNNKIALTSPIFLTH
ncbi:MAG: histidinol phosphatase [Clostridiaceae bacterium]